MSDHKINDKEKNLVVLEPFDIAGAIKEIERSGLDHWLMKMLVRSFYEARKGKLKTHDEHGFELHWIENISLLKEAILEERYEPGASSTFVIHDPMVREIFAAKFRDRVVHHFLYSMQAGWWDQRFIHNSFACRKGRGTLFGINQTQKMMRSAISIAQDKAEVAGLPRTDWRTPDFCPRIIKLDISGYFMSLPRSKVYRRVAEGLTMQFADYMDNPTGFRIYKICEYLWKQIIFDDPTTKAIKKGSLEDWDESVLPPRKSLFCQEPGVGLVIGNLTSQLCSNIYLDQLDRYVTMTLGYKLYGRYVDDFYMIVQADEYAKAKKDVKKIEEFLRDELELKLHEKKRYMQTVTKGVEFIGARIYPYCKYPSDRLQKRYAAAARKVALGQGEIESLASYRGLMKHLDAKKFEKEIFDKYGWDF